MFCKKCENNNQIVCNCKYDFAVGIDPGLNRNNGYAVWDIKNQLFAQILAMSFWELAGIIQDTAIYNKHKYHFFLENPAGNKPVWIQAKGGKNVAGKIAQNVGMNKAVGILWAQLFEQKKLSYTLVTPKKSSLTKMGKEQFQKLTGYKTRTNEHSRDAAMLVFGMKG